MINKPLFFEHLKRFWAIPALATLLYLLGVYASLLGNNGLNQNWALSQLADILLMQNPVLMFTVVLTPVITALCVFVFLFNKRATTFFYSLPINKKQLFFTSAAAGIFLSLIPIIVFCFVLLFPLEFRTSMREAHRCHGSVQVVNPFPKPSPYADLFGDRYDAYVPAVRAVDHEVTTTMKLNTVPIVLSLFLRMVIVSVFYFGVAWLAFSLAGHGIIGILIAFVMPFVPYALVQFVDMIGFLYVFGYRAALETNALVPFIFHHTPLLWGGIIDGVNNHTEAVIFPATVYTVIGAAIFTGAYFISRARKPERTGNSVMFAPVKNVLVFLVSLVLMFIPGLIFYAMSESFIMTHIGFVIGFAIGYVIAQMIAEKSFYIFEKLKYFPHFFGTAAAIYIFIFVF
ncbi:MAG: hypothetical protein FWD19_06290, partial [Defluviitaleaceae bacterium]|nr:hypothetical protein [Defluviitaleaceae bacterium]